MSMTAVSPADSAADVSAAPLPAPQSSSPAAARPTAQLIGAVVVLGAVVVAALGAFLDVGTLRWAGVGVVLLFGVGAAPLQLCRGLAADAFIAGSFLVSLSVLLVGGLTMAQLPWWHPIGAFIGLAVVTATLHIVGLRNMRRVPRAAAVSGAESDVPDVASNMAPVDGPERERGRLYRGVRAIASPSSACTAAGTALWLTAALNHRHLEPGVGGFVTQMPVMWFAGLALVVAGLVIADHDRQSDYAFAVLALTLALTVTPSLVYDWPRSTSAAKHVGMIEMIRHDHVLFRDPPVYRAWSGFFAGMAWFCDAAGIHDPMRMATWWPPVITVFRVATFRFLAGRVISDPAYCWMATALAVLADPTGADYYSPQSVGLVLGIAIFGFAIHPKFGPGRTAVSTWLVLIGGVAVAPSHQLSPYIISCALAVLVVFGVVRPWWVAALVVVPAVGWTSLHLAIVKTKLSWNQFGDTSNFRPPVTVAAAGLHRLPIVRETVMALVVGVLLIAVLAGIVLLRERNVRLWGVGFAAGAGIPIVAITAYGNEGIFRATIFAVPWLAVVAAGIFVTRGARLRAEPTEEVEAAAGLVVARRGTPWGQRALLSAVTGVLVTTFLVAAFGLDASNVVRTGDLRAFRQVEMTAEPGSALLALGQGNLPARSTYLAGDITNVGRDELPTSIGARTYRTVTDEVDDMTLKFRAYQSTGPLSRLYAIWSPTSSAFDTAYGIQTPTDFDRLRDAMLASRYWRVALSYDGTVLFQMVKVPPSPSASKPRR